MSGYYVSSKLYILGDIKYIHSHLKFMSRKQFSNVLQLVTRMLNKFVNNFFIIFRILECKAAVGQVFKYNMDITHIIK